MIIAKRLLLATSQLVSLALVTSACTPSRVITRDVPVEVRIPVAQPCALAAPTAPQPLREAIPDDAWQAMDTRQRAAAVAAQGLRWQSYGEAIRAGTAGCAVLP